MHMMISFFSFYFYFYLQLDICQPQTGYLMCITYLLALTLLVYQCTKPRLLYEHLDIVFS